MRERNVSQSALEIGILCGSADGIILVPARMRDCEPNLKRVATALFQTAQK